MSKSRYDKAHHASGSGGGFLRGGSGGGAAGGSIAGPGTMVGGSGSTVGIGPNAGGNTGEGPQHPLHYASVHSASYQMNAAAAAYMNKHSQVSRRSAVTKCSMDDEGLVLHGSDDESAQFLSNHELILNSSEFSDGQYGLTYVRCLKCDARLEIYSEDVLGGLIVICSTVIHREIDLVAPFLIDMIIAIMR